LIRSLDSTVRELLRRGPLHRDIQHHFDKWHATCVPHAFSRQEYREVALRSLLKPLELAGALADQMEADIRFSVSGVLQLMAHYVGIVPGCEEGTFIRDEVEYH
jgi:hypothetical protein